MWKNIMIEYNFSNGRLRYCKSTGICHGKFWIWLARY